VLAIGHATIGDAILDRGVRCELAWHLTPQSGRERRRRWGLEEKLRIVAATQRSACAGGTAIAAGFQEGALYVDDDERGGARVELEDVGLGIDARHACFLYIRCQETAESGHGGDKTPRGGAIPRPAVGLRSKKGATPGGWPAPHRHGWACPGHPSRHGAGGDGRD